jgi:hypothetical protein
MKRTKIMLMLIAALATIGTALAFKVAKKGSMAYYYLETTKNLGPVAGACPYRLEDEIGIYQPPTKFYYTTLTTDDCAHQTDCITQAKMP